MILYYIFYANKITVLNKITLKKKKTIRKIIIIFLLKLKKKLTLI